MEAIDLEQLLCGNGGPEQFPATHPRRTPQCPPTPKFYLGVRKGWSPEERRHVSRCEFCQHATALEWRIECPGVFTLARYLAEGETFEDLHALVRHLEADGCRRCALALRASFLKVLSALLRERKRTVDEIRAQADRMVLMYARLPALAPDGVHCEPLEGDARFVVSAESEAAGINLALCEGDSGELEVSLEAPTGIGVTRIEIIAESESRVETVPLYEAGERSAGARSLGSLAQQVRQLGKDCLVLVAPVENKIET